MNLLRKIPRLLKWILSIFMVFILLMTFFRFIFWFAYNPVNKAFSGSAFWLGFRFDLRIAGIIVIGILLFCAIPFLNPFKNMNAKKIWNFILPLLILIVVFFYAVDFYHFDYLHQRLNASVLNYLQDARISYKMIWQTYPLLKIIMVLITFIIVAYWGFCKLLNYYLTLPKLNNNKNILTYGIAILIFALLIVGNIVYKAGMYPLRWSDAYSLSDDFKANLALNPFQSFFSTLSFRNSTYDSKKLDEGYYLMANYLGVPKPDSSTLNFNRPNNFSETNSQKPNIVLVICESFSFYKSSMSGNPLNTTPFFNSLCNSGVFFNRCFTPSYGTARGVWATLTGIPDVESPRTASRNPNAVNQHVLINDFKGYEKFYFLGGSANWANIRGLFTNNITGLHLFEEGSYNVGTVDVWGVSDKNLFLETNKILRQQTNPFFAIIQTADNHRPYTIPAEDKLEFKEIQLPMDSLKNHGFESNDEYNAFRYTDFCFEKFITTAKNEKYFSNTIFVFVGDHGIPGNVGNLLPKPWTEQNLAYHHVPLLFYAPNILKPQKNNNICSQIDIMPSISSLSKMPCVNSTLGISLFDTSNKNEEYAFIYNPDLQTIGLINSSFYFNKNIKTDKKEFASIINNNVVSNNNYTDSVQKRLNQLTDAYYQTSKYLLLNNKKKMP